MKKIWLLFLLVGIASCAIGTEQPRFCPPLSQTVTGKIVGYRYDRFYLEVKEGASLQVGVSNSRLLCYLYEPLHADLYDGERFDFPEPGRYELRLALPRAFARRGEQVEYQMRVKGENICSFRRAGSEE